MRRYRGWQLFCIILGLVTLPSVLAIAIYLFTKDPTLRPLGVTQKKLEEQSAGKVIEVVAYVHWNSAKERLTKGAFRNAIIEAFAARDITPRLKIVEVVDQSSTITYQVGPSQIGPFPTSAAGHGIAAASAAYRDAVAYAHAKKTR